MTEMTMGFLPPDRQSFAALETFGEAMGQIARTLAPHHTAKVTARRWGLDRTTADNLAKGVASGPTVIKAVKAEGRDAWALWDAIGELIIGESRDTYDERNVARLHESAAHARQRLEDRRRRRLELEAGAGCFAQVADR